jgi:hypothetical protein
MNRPTAVLAVSLGGLVLAACADNAKADFQRCEELAKRAEFREAIKACELAHSKDPDTDSGRRAKAKIPVLERERNEKAEREAGPHRRTPEELPPLAIEPTKVTKVEITTGRKPTVALSKAADGWALGDGAKAHERNVATLLEALGKLKVTAIIAKSPDAEQLKKYELDADHAVHVVVLSDDQKLADIKFGKVGGRGPIALLDGQAVAVRGYSAYLFAREPNDWRATP